MFLRRTVCPRGECTLRVRRPDGNFPPPHPWPHRTAARPGRYRGVAGWRRSASDRARSTELSLVMKRTESAWWIAADTVATIFSNPTYPPHLSLSPSRRPSSCRWPSRLNRLVCRRCRYETLVKFNFINQSIANQNRIRYYIRPTSWLCNRYALSHVIAYVRNLIKFD